MAGSDVGIHVFVALRFFGYCSCCCCSSTTRTNNTQTRVLLLYFFLLGRRVVPSVLIDLFIDFVDTLLRKNPPKAVNTDYNAVINRPRFPPFLLCVFTFFFDNFVKFRRIKIKIYNPFVVCQPKRRIKKIHLLKERLYWRKLLGWRIRKLAALLISRKNATPPSWS